MPPTLDGPPAARLGRAASRPQIAAATLQTRRGHAREARLPGLPRAKCPAFRAAPAELLIPLVGCLLLVPAAFGAGAGDVLRRLFVDLLRDGGLLRDFGLRLLAHA